MTKSNRTKATSIPPEVRIKVEERDNHRCIFCKSPCARGEAHIISRAHGGLGVEQNIVTACRRCHAFMDNSQARELYLTKAKDYLRSIYPDWNEADLIYNKWKDFKYQ